MSRTGDAFILTGTRHWRLSRLPSVKEMFDGIGDDLHPASRSYFLFTTAEQNTQKQVYATLAVRLQGLGDADVSAIVSALPLNLHRVSAEAVS